MDEEELNFENIASLRVTLQDLPRDEAKKYLEDLVKFHEERGITLNGAIRYEWDEVTPWVVVNNQVRKDLGIKWKNGGET